MLDVAHEPLVSFVAVDALQRLRDCNTCDYHACLSSDTCYTEKAEQARQQPGIETTIHPAEDNRKKQRRPNRPNQAKLQRDTPSQKTQWIWLVNYLHFTFTIIPHIRHVQCMPQFWAPARPCLCLSVRNGLCPGMSIPRYSRSISPPRIDVHVGQHRPCCNFVKRHGKVTAAYKHPHQFARDRVISCCSFILHLMDSGLA